MRRFPAPLSAVFIALANPLPALADISASEVWSKWQDMATRIGYDLDIVRSDIAPGLVRLDDVTVRLPDATADAQFTLDHLEFRSLDDGRVEVILPETIPLSVASRTGGNDKLDMSALITLAGSQIFASGAPDDVTYDYSASRVAAELDQVKAEGAAIAPNVTVAMSGIEGQAHLGDGAFVTIEGDNRVGALDVAVAARDPETGGAFDLQFSITDMVSYSKQRFPRDIDFSSPDWILSKDVTTRGGATMGQTAGAIRIQGNQPFAMQAASASSEVAYAMSGGRVSYNFRATDEQIAVQSAAAPMPSIDLRIASSVFGAEMPIAPAGDEAQDFTILADISGVTLAPAVWDGIDPNGELPRDPASFRLDLSGTVKIDDSVLDTTAQPPGAAMPPIMPEDVSLNDLAISFLGALVQGEGKLTLLAGQTGPNGMPAAEGNLTLTADGLFAAMDALTAAGLMPAEQAMGFQMMLGLFARPGNGPDQLVSELALTADGTITANGQPLQ